MWVLAGGGLSRPKQQGSIAASTQEDGKTGELHTSLIPPALFCPTVLLHCHVHKETSK